MKNFIYFEDIEDGIQLTAIHTVEDLQYLYRWMSEAWVTEDKELLEWMETAKVGELFGHRMNYIVRLIDKED